MVGQHFNLLKKLTVVGLISSSLSAMALPMRCTDIFSQDSSLQRRSEVLATLQHGENEQHLVRAFKQKVSELGLSEGDYAVAEHSIYGSPPFHEYAIKLLNSPPDQGPYRRFEFPVRISTASQVRTTLQRGENEQRLYNAFMQKIHKLGLNEGDYIIVEHSIVDSPPVHEYAIQLLNSPPDQGPYRRFDFPVMK